MDTFRKIFLLGFILLNSILIFPCYDYIKAIEIPNFNVKMNTLRRNFVWGNEFIFLKCKYEIIPKNSVTNYFQNRLHISYLVSFLNSNINEKDIESYMSKNCATN